MATRHGLGRGLDALISKGTAATPSHDTATADGNQSVAVPLTAVQRAAWQPRKVFDEGALAELASSIAEHGVLQPLLVRPHGDGYELLAGERRLRAASDAGLSTVPVIIVEATDAEALEIALVENLQREDLNVIEAAQGYRTLTDKFGLTQEEIAKRLGKGRASVANTMRLLGLPADVQELLADGTVSAGHAKAILGLDIQEEQSLLATRIAREQLSVRETERIVERIKQGPRKPRAQRFDMPREHVNYLSERLHEVLGTHVKLEASRTYANGKKRRGSLQIDFYSNEDLDRILSILGIEID